MVMKSIPGSNVSRFKNIFLNVRFLDSSREEIKILKSNLTMGWMLIIEVSRLAIFTVSTFVFVKSLKYSEISGEVSETW